MTTHDMAQPRSSEQEFERSNDPQASSRASSIAFTLREPPIINAEVDGKQEKPSSASNDGGNSNILVIDWDGPEDAENPKKQAFIYRS